jgi:hypothetical protein
LNPSRNEDDTVGAVRAIIGQLEPELRDVIYLRYYPDFADSGSVWIFFGLKCRISQM